MQSARGLINDDSSYADLAKDLFGARKSMIGADES